MTRPPSGSSPHSVPTSLPREPLFLERQSYRRRRLMDAARLLPVLGLVLFLAPLLWTGPQDGARDAATAGGGLYLFGVWAVLILLGAIVSRRLVRPDDRAEDDLGGRADEQAVAPQGTKAGRPSTGPGAPGC